MPRRSGGSYLLRGGKPVLVAHSGGTTADKPAAPPVAVVESSATNVKKEKADAHTPKDAPSRA
ncbi:hypothetical protein [Vreelandella populi]|uniref:hypothetical protein n=1 Tax=Vreelandella populi TaxID=2498858 RepID=UPI000F8D758E|nr:hypothetical protein [Halomonas populi]RUR51418.1 hypothetical protein ELY40_16600 [Halomonas populi]